MRVIFCALALAICLTGCAPREEEAPAAVGEEDILLIINGKEVPAWRYLCWLDRNLEQGLEGAKARALSDTVLYAAVEDMAAEYGVTLTEEERSALTPGVWEGLREEQWRQLAAVGALYAKLCAMETAEEELRSFAAQEGYYTVDRILIPAGEGAADKAAEVFARLNGGGAAAFEAEKLHSADTLGSRTFRLGDGTLDGVLEAAAAELEEGQLSGILSSEEGFSILYCPGLDTSQVRIPWLDAQLARRGEEAEIQALPGYENLDISQRFQQILEGNVKNGEGLSSS